MLSRFVKHTPVFLIVCMQDGALFQVQRKSLLNIFETEIFVHILSQMRGTAQRSLSGILAHVVEPMNSGSLSGRIDDCY